MIGAKLLQEQSKQIHYEVKKKKKCSNIFRSSMNACCTECKDEPNQQNG